MLIHLKRNERLFLNGAVIRLDRRGTIELMNDAQFLLENHVMQAEQANSPLRQLYFVVQMMLMDPINAHLTQVLFDNNVSNVISSSRQGTHTALLSQVQSLVDKGDYFEALKALRSNFEGRDRSANAALISGRAA